MDKVKEKLIFMLLDDEGEPLYHSKESVGCLAEYLIANGVTVQELDGCEYCKEDNEGYRKMFGAFAIANPFHGSEWLITTGHCKPRQICFCPMCGRRLPKPPKGA
jgi:hypothetical protein